MKTSVITANYNNSKYLEDWFIGLVKQVKKPDYVCFVDDQSTDESWNTIIDLISEGQTPNDLPVKTFDCVRFGIKFHLEKTPKNSGPATARNQALRWISKNTDSQVTFVYDSDDIYHPDKISKTCNVYERYPFTGLVYSDYNMIYENGDKPKREFKEPFSIDRLDQECIVSNNSAFPTKLAVSIGGYDESLFGPEDYDLWLRIAENSPVFHIAEPLYSYRVSPNQLTAITDQHKFAQHVRQVHEKAYQRRNHAPAS